MSAFLRTLTLLASGLLLISVPASAGVEDGLVGYWSFDEGVGDTVFDYSGNGNNGQCFNVSWIDGVEGSALHFNGTNAYALCSSAGPAGGSPRTVVAWARNDSLIDQVIMSYGNYTGPGASFRVGLPPNVLKEGAGVDISSAAITYDANVYDASWHCYAFVVPDLANPSLEQVLVYQDGVLLTDVVYVFNGGTHVNTGSSNGVNIGRVFPPDPGRYLHGDLDELRLYDRALSQAEIEFLYEHPSGYICGDADGSGSINVSDAIYLLGYIFGRNDGPLDHSGGDYNSDGRLNLSDCVYLIAYIFGGGPEPCAAS